MVTILIPAYNAEKTLEKAIKSILCQTYENWKLVIMNDGSRDKTEEICRKYSEKDRRISYYSQHNKGLIETRKVLLRYVQGEYWTFVDADDILHCQMLEIFVKKAVEIDADIVMTESVQYVSKHFLVGLKNSKYMENPKGDIYTGKELLPNFFRYPKYHVGLHSKLFSTSLLDVINLEKLPSIFWGEDQCINALLFSKAEKVVLVSKLLYNYRDGGTSHTFTPQISEDMIRFYRWRKEFIQENRLGDELMIASIINVLNTFKSLCGGNKINGAEVYKVLYDIIRDMNMLCPEVDVSSFYNSLKGKNTVWVEKDRVPLSIKIKQFVLRCL